MAFIPFAIEFAQRQLDYDDATDKLVRERGLMDEIFAGIHEGMTVQYIHQMNVNALSFTTEQLGAIGVNEEVLVPNVYLWVRDLMTMATCEALYGSENPMKKQPSLLDDLWYE